MFITILFAGLTSAVAVFEPMVNSTMHKFGWSRKKTVTVLSIIGCFFSLFFTTAIGSYLVGVVDGFANKFGILFLLAVQCIIFGWFFDIDSLIPVLNENSRFKVGKVWKCIIKYVLPIFIIFVWAIGIYELFLSAKTFEIIVYCIIIIIVLVVSAVFTKKESKD